MTALLFTIYIHYLYIYYINILNIFDFVHIFCVIGINKNIINVENETIRKIKFTRENTIMYKILIKKPYGSENVTENIIKIINQIVRKEITVIYDR